MKPRLPPQAPLPVRAPPPAPRDALALDYQWTNEQIKLLTDIRFRLLTFMPPLVGVGSAILSVGLGQTALPPMLMLSVAVFGFFATLGVILYDLRNSELYNAHIHRAMLIERSLKMRSHSAFASPGFYAGPHTLRMWASRRLFGFGVNHGSALSLVYAAILAAWVYPASRGLLAFAASANDNTNALLALLLALVAGYVFYKLLRAVDVPGLAEACVYDDANEARAKVRDNYEEKRLEFLTHLRGNGATIEELKSKYANRLVDHMKASGCIRIDKGRVSLTESGRRALSEAYPLTIALLHASHTHRFHHAVAHKYVDSKGIFNPAFRGSGIRSETCAPSRSLGRTRRAPPRETPNARGGGPG